MDGNPDPSRTFHQSSVFVFSPGLSLLFHENCLWFRSRPNQSFDGFLDIHEFFRFVHEFLRVARVLRACSAMKGPCDNTSFRSAARTKYSLGSFTTNLSLLRHMINSPRDSDSFCLRVNK